MNKKFLLLSITGLFLLSACVGDQQIMVTEYDDEEKNCSQLKFELSNLGVQFQDAKDDSGLTGKNVAQVNLYATENGFEIFVFALPEHHASFLQMVRGEADRLYTPAVNSETVFLQIKQIFEDLCIGDN